LGVLGRGALQRAVDMPAGGDADRPFDIHQINVIGGSKAAIARKSGCEDESGEQPPHRRAS
jgi:hypothetical protein